MESPTKNECAKDQILSTALYLLSYRVQLLVGQIDGLYHGIDMGKKAFVGANTNLLRDKLYLENIGKKVGFEELWLI